MMSEIKLRTLAILVNNEAGVLSQITRLFSRKGYNIESLAVGVTDDAEVSRITIEINADDGMIRQLKNQLRKLIPVYSVKELAHAKSIRRELLLIKVKAETPDVRNQIIQIANVFRANIIDVSQQSLTVATIGDEGKDDALQGLLRDFGILEMARTGMIALERGAYTLNEESKEKGEFYYGKNVL